MRWVVSNIGMVTDLLVRHAWLSAIPVVVSFVLAVPLGWYASRHPRLRGGILGAGSILYTVPSLPLFVMMPSIIGTDFLSPLNVLIALSMYGVAIMVRSSTDAFTSVSAEVLEGARATGHSGRQRLLSVQLPLAGPVLLAGLRVVSVSTISLVSVGSLIGVTSLGNLFTDGFHRDFVTEILVGVVATVVLAVVFDLVIVGLGRALMPWRSKGAAR